MERRVGPAPRVEAQPTAPPSTVPATQPNDAARDPGNLPTLLRRLPRSPIPLDDETIVTPVSLAQLMGRPGDREVMVPQKVAWHEAKHHVGRPIILEAHVVRTRNIGALTFLNFSENWQNTFTVVVFEPVYEDLPGPPEDYFKGRRVRVTGTVTVHKDRPNLEVHDVRQIKIIPAAPDE